VYPCPALPAFPLLSCFLMAASLVVWLLNQGKGAKIEALGVANLTFIIYNMINTNFDAYIFTFIVHIFGVVCWAAAGGCGGCRWWLDACGCVVMIWIEADGQGQDNDDQNDST